MSALHDICSGDTPPEVAAASLQVWSALSLDDVKDVGRSNENTCGENDVEAGNLDAGDSSSSNSTEGSYDDHLGSALAKMKRSLLAVTVPAMWAGMMSKLSTATVATPQIMALGLTGSQFGLVLSSFFFSYSTLQYPSLWVATRLGERLWLTLNLLVMGGFTILKSAVPNFWTLALCNVVVGASQAAVQPILYRNMDKHLPAAEASSTWSLVYTTNTVGGVFLGPLAAVIMLAGWRWVYIAYGLVTMCVGVAVLLFMLDSPETTKVLSEPERDALLAAKEAERSAAAPDADESAQTGSKPTGPNAVLKWWRTWYLGIAAFMFQQIIMAGTQFGPQIYYDFLQRHNPLGNPDQQQSRANFLLTTSSVACVLGSLVAGQFLRRLPGQRFWYGSAFFATAITLSALVSAVAAVSTSLAGGVIIYSLAFGVTFSCAPMLDTLPVAFCNADGLASGMFSIMTSFKGAAGLTAPLIFGALQDFIGTPAAYSSMTSFLILAAIMFAGFFFLVRVGPFERRQAEDKLSSSENTSSSV